MSDQTVLQVGVGKQFQTINAAITAADQMGGNADIKVDAGTYTNDGGYLWDGINNVTIEGVGGMVKIVDPTYYAGGKAAIVTGGQNILLKNLDISGVTVPDGNGAAIRYDQGTLLLDNVHLHNNQNGILAASDLTGSITIQNSEIDHNGTSAGNTHNIYIGDVGQFTLTNSYIHDANVGHEVKSRAENNTITNNRIQDNSGSSSYAIDLPNGGNATITGNVIEQGANNQNHTINAYGEEGNLHAGKNVKFSNNVVVNDDAEGRGPVWNTSGNTITGSGNTVWNATDLGNGVSS
ncbi:MAG: right-handed parallel beta-helix repeat-containing protein, partial [Oxalobacteraceae bacterium]